MMILTRTFILIKLNMSLSLTLFVFSDLLDQPVFTVWLENRGILNQAAGGVFTFGAVDTKNCGPVIAYQPLSAATYYQFKVTCTSLLHNIIMLEG